MTWIESKEEKNNFYLFPTTTIKGIKVYGLCTKQILFRNVMIDEKLIYTYELMKKAGYTQVFAIWGGTLCLT